MESYTYEKGRFIKTHTDVLGQVESFIYDPVSGLLSSQTDIAGDESTFTYDGFGKIKTQSLSSSSGNRVSTNWTWTNGNPSKSVVLRSETTEDGQIIKTWYDVLGREIQSSHKNFQNTSLVYISLVCLISN